MTYGKPMIQSVSRSVELASCTPAPPDYCKGQGQAGLLYVDENNFVGVYRTSVLGNCFAYPSGLTLPDHRKVLNNDLVEVRIYMHNEGVACLGGAYLVQAC